jgi:Leucine-rich repeat (LRR) protein
LQNGKEFIKINNRYRSEEALELHTYVKKLGNMPEYCIQEYLINFFETLYFQRMGIEKMDASLAKMGNLKILNLSYNKLQALPSHLPPKIQELNLTGNNITDINLGAT